MSRQLWRLLFPCNRTELKRCSPITASLMLAAIYFANARSFGQPNVVLIVSDDAGYNGFGFMADLYGNTTDIQTPNLDALAGRSLLMSSAYVSGAICSPSRAGFLTGRYSHRFGYEDNPGPLNGLPANQQLISHHLKDLGYTTGALGKWHLGEIDGVNRPLDMGFDEFYGFLGGGRPYWGLGSTDSGRTMRRGDNVIESQWVNEGNPNQYDPASGRYLTDAVGEEAVDFINRHASDENPFFMYVAFNAPHTPLQAKQSDLNHFAGITNVDRRTVAAMTYALDRAVGDITNAISQNGIDENTIVIFMNDNGGPSTAPHSNYPLKGNKGSLWEGGIRVPLMISAPGLSAGVYDNPVMSLDLLPTIVNMAGGNAAQIETDGTDLMPFLTGQIAGDPHELMFWRGVDGRFAVRKGDWKLVRPGAQTFARLHDVVDDIDESNYVNSQHPEVVAELLRELTNWEAGLQKPKWGPLGASMNTFDHFVLRTDQASANNWSTASAWKQAGTSNNVTLRAVDAYANAILEFQTRDDADYTATNDMTRSTLQTFMLHQLRLTGTFAGSVNRQGRINGNALLFTKNLAGANPSIHMEATAATGASFAFEVDNEIQLFDDLEITGDGTQSLLLNGNIRDFYEPRNVIKSGSSTARLAGNNTFKGSLIIHEGRIESTNLAGDLENHGGTFALGASPAVATLQGDIVQTNGTLEIQIGGTEPGIGFDKLEVSGSASIGGTLAVKLVNDYTPSIGQQFEFLTTAQGVVNTFDDFELPALAEGMWTTIYGATSMSLLVVMDGDFNADGVVDAADYVVLRKGTGSHLSQYEGWRANFRESADYGLAGDSSNNPAVPEPTMLAVIGIGVLLLRGRRR